MLVVLFNNLPQLIGLLLWSALVFWAGRRWERWRNAHHWFHRANKEASLAKILGGSGVNGSSASPTGGDDGAVHNGKGV